MESKKLEKWANQLLDLGKRNALVAFKDTKHSTLEALSPDAGEIYTRLMNGGALEAFKGKNEEDEIGAPDKKVLLSREEYLARYMPLMKKQRQVLFYNALNTPGETLAHLTRRTKEFLEETGVNVLYLAFGFIRWHEESDASTIFRAPLLLVPVQSSQESLLEPFIIKATGDDDIVNPTFAYLLSSEYGITLPDHGEESLAEYLAKVSSLLSPLSWEVTGEVKMGIFSFQKLNMYRDLHDHEPAILSNETVQGLLGEAASPEEQAPSNKPLADPLIELHSVVNADSSQIEAIELAKAGVSFVLQGPPGTGKSQTITNIIAECLNDGKKVLFVSEKLAALEVVHDKLAKAGLADFCLELHSHKANKKDVIAELCRVLHAGKSEVSGSASLSLAVKKEMEEELDAYAVALHEPIPFLGKSLYALYEALASYPGIHDSSWPIPRLSRMDEVAMMKDARLLEQYASFVPSIGRDYHEHPWYGYRLSGISHQETETIAKALPQVIGFLSALSPLSVALHDAHDIACASVAQAEAWQPLLIFLSESTLVGPALLSEETFKDNDARLSSLASLAQEIAEIEERLGAEYDEGLYQFNASVLSRSLSTDYHSFFKRLLSRDYRALMKRLRSHRRIGHRLSYRKARALAADLTNREEKRSQFKALEAKTAPSCGTLWQGLSSDWERMDHERAVLRAAFSRGMDFGRLSRLTREEYDAARESLSRASHALKEALSLKTADWETVAMAFDERLVPLSRLDISRLLPKLTSARARSDEIGNYVQFRDLLGLLDEASLREFVDLEIKEGETPELIPAVFKKSYYREWIESVIAANPVLSGFTRAKQDKAVSSFREKDQAQFAINQAMIRSRLSLSRPSLSLIASGSPVAILLREGEKKRKQKSVRLLLSEIGPLVQELKPCFLMSPLSVSTYLSTDDVRFDVVIFDEASQVFPEDAIGALYRSRQAIIVGDSRQMPPSSFFMTTVPDDEDEDEESGDVTDFESILDLAAASLRHLRLSWHYRSRNEALIAFSNRYFYDNSLVTFPSACPSGPDQGVGYIHVDGVFDRKSHTNRVEAEEVVKAIGREITTYPGRSLGVVAFSVAQQTLIERLLAKERLSHPENEWFFKSDRPEPFFIKNLETVQGDERDVIIFSVAYARDATGRLINNFGPLNAAGGERRLNVAITRAKIHVLVMSSLHAMEFDLSHTTATGALRLRDYLDYAEHGPMALSRSLSVSSDASCESPFEEEVRDVLVSHGYAVDAQVGCAGYRIDLGLKRPGTSDYVLAIEADGATYHAGKNARDRDCLRQQVLEGLGWRFYRIWSTDWFRNRAIEEKRLLARCALSLKEEAPLVPLARASSSSFERPSSEAEFHFPPYVAVNVKEVAKKHFHQGYYDFPAIMREIILCEAPLSASLLIRRTLFLLDRTVVNDGVRADFARLMKILAPAGITMKDGFVYANSVPVVFRAPGDLTRALDDIAPEELASGMETILSLNKSSSVSGLYALLARACGVTKVGPRAKERFDQALGFLSNKVTVKDDLITWDET